MTDLISIERDLVRQKQLINRHYETGSGRQALVAAQQERATFAHTLSIFEQHGDEEMKAMITRVRENF